MATGTKYKAGDYVMFKKHGQFPFVLTRKDKILGRWMMRAGAQSIDNSAECSESSRMLNKHYMKVPAVAAQSYRQASAWCQDQWPLLTR